MFKSRFFLRAMTFIVLVSSFTSNAQFPGLENYCKHNDSHMIHELIGGDETKAAQIEADEAALEAYTQQFQPLAESGGSSFVIPVVFHIIHDNGQENISDAQVRDAIRVLNDDFNKLNPDTATVVPAFAGNIADVGIEFRLAQLDPNGNCTKGINRILSDLTYDGDQSMKNLIQWPRDKYLNVWVCAEAQGAAGYTFLPGTVNSNFAAAWDGIVLKHNYTGSIGTSNSTRSRTLTHEVGHWLNLPHLWGGTNDPGLLSNCGDDDNVADTPNTIGWTNCNTSGVSCGSLDNVQNYMEYSYCARMFTNGQKSRMLAALTSGTADRNELWQPSNLTSTGTSGFDVLCEADFSSNLTVICAGDSIQFTDDSYHGVTQRTWTFQGGTPAVSTMDSPWVVFNTPGQFDVTLSASNGVSSVSENRVAFITVLPTNGFPVPAQDGFESYTSIPNNDWMTVDTDNDGTWYLTDDAAFTGTQSIMLDNDVVDSGKQDEIISSTFDMSAATDVNISFRYSYAQRNATSDDVLRLYVSRDCGASWSMRRQLRGSTNLATAGMNTGHFVPSNQGEWGYQLVDNISSSYHVSDFRFKFWFQSDAGNNIYIDDININGTPVGIDEFGRGESPGIGLRVFPSPATDFAQVSVDLEFDGPILFELYNSVGQIVQVLDKGNITKGSLQFGMDVSLYPSGVYLLKAVQEERTRVFRFLVD